MRLADQLQQLGKQAGQPRILVVTLRRLGDVLLTTPLLRSLRRAFPDAQIDALVFRGSDGILAGNPDLSNVVTIPLKPSLGDGWRLIRDLWRRYDLAISTQAGDRPTLAAWVAGRHRIGIVTTDDGWGPLKHRLLHGRITADLGVHRVEELMRLADLVGVAAVTDLVCPQGAPRPVGTPDGPYAVLHPNPKFPYRRWNTPGWRQLAAALQAQGLTVVVTGAPDPDERAYLDSIWTGTGTPVNRLDGALDWRQLAALIGGASVYVGPDTSMTHLAAGTGCPTVALYGPASPVDIGPWPVGGLSGSWRRAGTIQHHGNVWLVQNPLPCMPCEQMGCDRHFNSRSQCLDDMTVGQVLLAVNSALASRHQPVPATSTSRP